VELSSSDGLSLQQWNFHSTPYINGVAGSRTAIAGRCMSSIEQNSEGRIRAGSGRTEGRRMEDNQVCVCRAVARVITADGAAGNTPFASIAEVLGHFLEAEVDIVGTRGEHFESDNTA
jgi:hypothetical protein